MNSYKKDFKLVLREIFQEKTEYTRINSVINNITAAGGLTYLVGGAVRDILLQDIKDSKNIIKDIDIEVHGLPLEKLKEILSIYAPVSMVGASFGVLMWEKRLERSVEWVLPRIDFAGRKPEVILDPKLNIKQALTRRDLTINALAIDLVSGELIDPFGGVEDLKKRIARSPNINFFVEDPLRFFRVMQFIGRFELTPDEQLNNLCKHMSLKNISQERIFQEFNKLFLKSQKPSLGLRWLNSINRLAEILPELAGTVGVLQESHWHPEGDVFEHTMQTLDIAATFEYKDDIQKLILLSAALCHDLGKVESTHIRDGKIRSTGHEETGIEPTKILLKRITNNKKHMSTVVKLVRYHRTGAQIAIDGRDVTYKKLAIKLAPQTNMRELAMLIKADLQGREPRSKEMLVRDKNLIETFISRAKKLGIFDGPLEPILTGHDIKSFIAPGPHMGVALKYAYKLQLEEHITDKNVLIKRVQEFMTTK